ncbi:MAG: hypothetical protein AAF357_06755, partial [Verrucomicrobiota bacterium]
RPAKPKPAPAASAAPATPAATSAPVTSVPPTQVVYNTAASSTPQPAPQPAIRIKSMPGSGIQSQSIQIVPSSSARPVSSSN